jgi:hypothetical protein
MSDHIQSNHLSAENLVDYFDKTLTEDEQETFEVHIAACDDCARRAQQAFALCQEWEQWTAWTHREAVQQALIARGLAEAMTQERPDIPNWQARLERWRAASARLARRARRAVSGTMAHSARTIAEGLETLLPPGNPGSVGYDLAPVRVRGAGRRTRGGPAGPRLTATIAYGPWTHLIKVVADAHTREVAVWVEQLPQGPDQPLVMLASEGHKTRFQLLERVPHGQSCIARFEEVEPGDYVVAIEPQVSITTGG